MNTSIKRLLISSALLLGAINLGATAQGQGTYPSGPNTSMTSTTAPYMMARPTFPVGVAGCPNFLTPPAFPVTPMQYVPPTVTGGAAVVRPVTGVVPVMPIMPTSPAITGGAAIIPTVPTQACPSITGGATVVTPVAPVQNWPPTCTMPGSCPGYTITVPSQTLPITGGAAPATKSTPCPITTPCPTTTGGAAVVTPPSTGYMPIMPIAPVTPGVTGGAAAIPAVPSQTCPSSTGSAAIIAPIATSGAIMPVMPNSPPATGTVTGGAASMSGSSQSLQFPTGGAAGVPAGRAAAAAGPPKPLGTQVVGDYRINLLAEPAKGWYQWQGSQLTWMPPAANTNIHLEVPLLEAQGNRPLPDATVMANVYDQNNTLVDSKQMIMLWSPRDYHYGNNFTIPSAGNYTVRIQSTPPQFARHDINLGKRFSQPASAAFTNIRLTPMGQLNA